MQNKNILSSAILTIITIFFVTLSIFLFQNLRKLELGFNEKKALLVKENLDLKDRVESLQEMVNQKTESINSFEKEKLFFDEKLNQIKKDSKELIKSYSDKLKALVRQKSVLKGQINSIKKAPPARLIQEALGKEENISIKKLLENTLNKIELIKSGKTVELEPIIVRKEKSQLQPPPPQEVAEKEERQGAILSLDRENNFMVINLGRRDGIKEGDRCEILKDGEKMAEGEIMSIRYRISAVFIDYFHNQYTINDIKEGFKVAVLERWG